MPNKIIEKFIILLLLTLFFITNIVIHNKVKETDEFYVKARNNLKNVERLLDEQKENHKKIKEIIKQIKIIKNIP